MLMVEFLLPSPVLVSNSTQYWSHLNLKLDKVKEILPSTCRIRETVFTPMAVLGGKLYRNHPKNWNNMHKDVKYLVSVIITLGKDIIRGDTVFYDGVKSCDFGRRSHLLKHSHGLMVSVPFEKIFPEGTLWSGYRAVISFILTKQIFLHFYSHANQFCLPNLDIGHKTDSHDYRNVGKFVLSG